MHKTRTSTNSNGMLSVPPAKKTDDSQNTGCTRTGMPNALNRKSNCVGGMSEHAVRLDEGNRDESRRLYPSRTFQTIVHLAESPNEADRRDTINFFGTTKHANDTKNNSIPISGDVWKSTFWPASDFKRVGSTHLR